MGSLRWRVTSSSWGKSKTNHKFSIDKPVGAISIPYKGLFSSSVGLSDIVVVVVVFWFWEGCARYVEIEDCGNLNDVRSY